MANDTHIAGLILIGAGLLALPGAAQPQAGMTPKPVALCLPPGGKPAPCAAARAGQTIRLQVATTNLPNGPIQLRFAEETSGRQPPRAVSVTIPPVRSLDGGYDVRIPPEICAGGRSSQGQFEIQNLMSTYNQAETAVRSLGTLTIAC
jgi:hypothetical protein